MFLTSPLWGRCNRSISERGQPPTSAPVAPALACAALCHALKLAPSFHLMAPCSGRGSSSSAVGDTARSDSRWNRPCRPIIVSRSLPRPFLQSSNALQLGMPSNLQLGLARSWNHRDLGKPAPATSQLPLRDECLFRDRLGRGSALSLFFRLRLPVLDPSILPPESVGVKTPHPECLVSEWLGRWQPSV